MTSHAEVRPCEGVSSSRDRYIGLVQLAVGATLISFSGGFVTLAEVGPTMAGVYRNFIGGAILLAIVLVRRKRLWWGFGAFRACVLCALLFGLELSFYHRSIRYVGMGLACLLGNFQFLFLAGFGIAVLGEKPSWKLFVSFFLSLLGLFMIVGIDWGDLEKIYKIGVVLGLITAFLYSAYLLVLRRIQSGTNFDQAMANMVVISLVSAFAMWLEGLSQHEIFWAADSKSWWALIAYGLVSQASGWLLISKGLPKLEASRAGLVLLLQPTLAFFWDVLFFARPIDVVEIIGLVLALGGIYLGTSRKRP